MMICFNILQLQLESCFYFYFSEFEQNEHLNPMCSFSTLPDCERGMMPHECTHWKCCKLSSERMRCLRSGENNFDGYCKTTNPNCFRVNCTCEHESSSEEGTIEGNTSITTQRLTYIERSTAQTNTIRESSTLLSSIGSTELDKQKHSHQQ